MKYIIFRELMFSDLKALSKRQFAMYTMSEIYCYFARNLSHLTWNHTVKSILCSIFALIISPLVVLVTMLSLAPYRYHTLKNHTDGVGESTYYKNVRVYFMDEKLFTDSNISAIHSKGGYR